MNVIAESLRPPASEQSKQTKGRKSSKKKAKKGDLDDDADEEGVEATLDLEDVVEMDDEGLNEDKAAELADEEVRTVVEAANEEAKQTPVKSTSRTDGRRARKGRKGKAAKKIEGDVDMAVT